LTTFPVRVSVEDMRMRALFDRFTRMFRAMPSPAVVALPSTQSLHPQIFSIRNRKHQRIVVWRDDLGTRGTAVVMHGLGCSKFEADTETMSRALRDEGYTVVRFDATNGVGDSDGSFRRATVTNYLADLERVIEWAMAQPWYRGPLILAGYDIGGMCVTLFAAGHVGHVHALILLAPIISGALSFEMLQASYPVTAWKALGSMVWESQSRPGLIRRLDWAHMKDRLRYDLLPLAGRLIMPVLHVVHEKDRLTPILHQEWLHEAIPAPSKTWYLLSNAHHRLRHESHFQKLYELIRLWLREGKVPPQ
jgi:pimeloyl-ACP methyl ester carboxylesterase